MTKPRRGKSGAAEKAVRTNEKGEITSWDGNSPDGKLLSHLFDQGVITTQTAKQLADAYPQYRRYAGKCLNAALHAMRKSKEKQVKLRQSRGSAVLKTMSNLAPASGDSYVSAEDSTYAEDLTDAVSRLGMGDCRDDDDFTYDTVTTAYESQAYKSKQHGNSPPKHMAKIYGNTKIGLPYVLDVWRDSRGALRISLQIMMLSGKDLYKRVFVRVSTAQKEVVLTLPMSPYLRRSDFAFDTFLLASTNISPFDKHCVRAVLKHHPKTAARMVGVSKIKGRSNTDGFFYEQRIALPRKVAHDPATASDGDELFFGKKFVEYPDQSVFLHLELVCEKKDNYIPEERMLDPSLMQTPNRSNPVAEGGNAACVLQMDEDVSGDQTCSRKRRNMTLGGDGTSSPGGNLAEEESHMSALGVSVDPRFAGPPKQVVAEMDAEAQQAAREEAARVLGSAKESAQEESSGENHNE